MVKKDHCTVAPDFDFGATCCKEHDDDYTAGRKTRAQADADLMACIAASGKPWRAFGYWLGVRVGGWLFWRRKQQKREEATNATV